MSSSVNKSNSTHGAWKVPAPRNPTGGTSSGKREEGEAATQQLALMTFSDRLPPLSPCCKKTRLYVAIPSGSPSPLRTSPFSSSPSRTSYEEGSPGKFRPITNASDSPPSRISFSPASSESSSRSRPMTPQEFEFSVTPIKERYSPILFVSFPEFLEEKLKQKKLHPLLISAIAKYKKGQPLDPVQTLKFNKVKEEYERKYDGIFTRALSGSYSLYGNAYAGDYKVLGGEALRDDTRALTNFGVLAGRAPLKKVGDTLAGGILCDKEWDLLRNDAAMIGAIHKAQDIYIWNASTDNSNNSIFPPDEVLFDKNENRPRVLGRELLMLEQAGYRRLAYRNEEAMGLVFVCMDRAKAESYEFSDVEEIDSVQCIGRIHQFIMGAISEEEYKKCASA